MHKTVDIQLGADILEANKELAHNNSHRFKTASVRAFDFMGSIGSGKTLLIEALAECYKADGIRGCKPLLWVCLYCKQVILTAGGRQVAGEISTGPVCGACLAGFVGQAPVAE